MDISNYERIGHALLPRSPYRADAVAMRLTNRGAWVLSFILMLICCIGV